MQTINKKVDPCAIDNAFESITSQYRQGKASLDLLNFRQADKLKLLQDLKDYGIRALIIDNTCMTSKRMITG